MEYEEGGAKTVDRGIGAPYSEISYLRHTQYAERGTRRVYLHPRRGPDTTR